MLRPTHLEKKCYPPSDLDGGTTVILATGTTIAWRRTTSTTANTRDSEPESEKLTTTPSNGVSSASAPNISSGPGMNTSATRNRTVSPSRVERLRYARSVDLTGNLFYFIAWRGPAVVSSANLPPLQKHIRRTDAVARSYLGIA
jgi:hypothetical protein